MSESEKDFAVRLANKVLDDASRDPDDDLSVLARQFLRALESKWQPIETAPWSGPSVLLWKEKTREHYVAARVIDAHGPGWCTPDGFEIFGATSWQPLPEAPQ